MSVSNTNNKVIYPSNGTSGPFTFSYNVYLSTDIVASIQNSTTDVETVITMNTDYTVALTHAAPTTGSITLIRSYALLAAGYNIIIKRILPLTQLISLADNDETPAATYEEGYDRETMIAQQLQEQIDRAILQENVDYAGVGKLTIPAPESDKVLGWNTAATALENKDPAPAGPPGPQGPAGPPGPGTGDVLGPAVSPNSGVPQWNGANSKTLKAGLVVGTAALNLVQLDGSAKLPAVDGSQLTGLPSGTGDVTGPATNTADYVPQWNGANSKKLKDGVAIGTTASCLVQLDGSAKLPAVDGSQLTGIVGTAVPTGTILLWGAAAAPSGYVLCDGTSYTVAAKTALHNVIGDTFGGDGGTNFNVPSLKGNVAVGYKAADANFGTLGGTGGEKTHQLTVPEMPSHTHTGPYIFIGNQTKNFTSGFNAGTGATDSTGGDGSHNNLQPYLVINYIIKT